MQVVNFSNKKTTLNPKMKKSYEQKIAELRTKPITIIGSTAEEIQTIRAALKLYSTRNAEKHTTHSNMGWGKKAKTAEELEIRILG